VENKSLKSSAYYHNCLQVVGTLGEIALFFAGIYVGKGIWLLGLSLILIRILFKIIMSRLMYRRMQATIREKGERVD